MIGTILLVIGISLIILFFTQRAAEEPHYFTAEPETWVEPDYETAKSDDIEINVYKATKGKSIVDEAQQDYYESGDIVSLFYSGLYKGNMFETAYLNPLFYELAEGKSLDEQKELAAKYTLMRIGPKMDANDGVINGFALLKKENNAFVVYLFVDSDWKSKVEYTNILWGNNFDDINTMRLKPFNF